MLQSYIVTLLHCDIVPPCPKARKSNLGEPIFTASWPRYYGSFQFSDFVLKIDPIRRPKFGTSKKMLYLCTRKHEDVSSCVRTNKAVSGGPMQIVAKILILCKTHF